MKIRAMFVALGAAGMIVVSGYSGIPDTPVSVDAGVSCGRCFQEFVVQAPLAGGSAAVHWLPDGINAITLTTGRSGRCFNWSSTLGIDHVLVESPGAWVNRYDYSPEALHGRHLHASDRTESCEKSQIARIRFCFDREEYGCVRGPDYWKSHSAYGPGDFDRAWDLLDESADTLFALSGQTFLEALRNPPRQGNAYYTLGHQYIAAFLNVHAGAAVPEPVGYALASADSLFGTYLPDEIADLSPRNELRQAFLDLALILEDFNRGFMGVPDCDCCAEE